MEIHATEPATRLARDGYVVLPDSVDGATLERALAIVVEQSARDAGRVTRDLPEMLRDPVVWNLQNKDFLFLTLLFGLPRVQELLVHFLNDPWYRRIPAGEPNYILRAYIARSGMSFLPLHIDSFFPYPGPEVISMQCVIPLEDMTRRGGATLVVPGSHLSGAYAPQSAMAEAVAIEARAGDVVLWDSRLWHAAAANETGRTRWALIATFTRWWIKQSFDITGTLPREFYERLSKSQRAVLGYCSIPHTDEFEGIVTQRGYDSLPEAPPRGGR